MPIPPEIAALVDRLNQELNETEQEATEGVNLVRPLLSRFPDNVILIRFFTFFNNSLLFVEISRRRIQAIVERVSAPDVTGREIQDAEEDLRTLLGRVRSAKMSGRRLLDVLEKLR